MFEILRNCSRWWLPKSSQQTKNIFKVGNIVKNISAVGVFIMISRHAVWLEDSEGVAPRASMKNVFLKISLDFLENICVCRGLVLQLHQIETLVRLLSCELYEILKKTFFVNIWEWLLLESKIFCLSLFS